jgi:taurine dioxygenase
VTSAVLNRYDVGPLPDNAPFGVTVRGLTLAHLEDPSVRRSLADLWVQQGVILFRDCEDSTEMHVEISKGFGPLLRSVFAENWVDGNPELNNIYYAPDNGTVDRINGEVLGGYLPWHTDRIYTDTLNRGGILRPVQLPTAGGMTGFIDKILAYQRLPDDLKARIEGLHVVYAVDLNLANSRFARPGEVISVREGKAHQGIMRRRFTYLPAVHPMVFEQAETGRKVLNVSPWFAQGVYEMGGSDGDELLSEVVAHCTSEANAYYHRWRMGDMVLWDNWRTLHACTGVPENDTRIMRRTTIAGDYALGRGLGGPVSEAKFDV